MVRIMFGCDKFCTYCIVPRVRGPEQSRPAAEILDEVRRLADDGCLEVTLLGQTVNSYRDSDRRRSTVGLADLLCKLHDIDGLRRLKFVTNYPAAHDATICCRRCATCRRSRPICTFRPKAARTPCCGG